MTFQILDCTLRDGGYYCKWDFDEQLVDQYLEAMVVASVDILEIGYVSFPQSSPVRAPGYFGKYFYIHASTATEIRAKLHQYEQKLSGSGKIPQIAVMCNAKEFVGRSKDEITRLFGPLVGLLDIVRFAVSPQLDSIKDVLRCADILKNDFSIALNLMYLSNYLQDDDHLKLLSNHQSSFSTLNLVDSYGSCFPKQVGEAFQKLATIFGDGEKLPTFGYHGHNNLSLAFANALEAISSGATIIDGTITGMGRGAGNLQTELIVLHRAESTQTDQASKHEKHLSSHCFSSLVNSFETLKKSYGWGISLPYIMAGVCGVAQGKVMEYVQSERYEISSIVKLCKNTKSVFDYTEYENFSKHAISSIDSTCVQASSSNIDSTVAQSSSSSHSNATTNGIQNLLVIGGGPSVHKHCGAIEELSKRLNAPLVGCSFKSLLPFKTKHTNWIVCYSCQKTVDTLQKQPDLLVVRKAPRFQPITGFDSGFSRTQICQVEPFSSQIDYGDSPISVALSVAKELKPSNIFLAGFDGFAAPTRSQSRIHDETHQILESFAKSMPLTQIFTLFPSFCLPKTIPILSCYSLLSQWTIDDIMDEFKLCNRKRVVALLPARYASSRLHGKLLKKLNSGKSVLQHTWEQTKKAKLVDQVYVCGDDPLIEKEVQAFGGQYIATSKNPINGTERITEALQHVPAHYQIIVNVQADEPITNPLNVDAAIFEYFKVEKTSEFSKLAAVSLHAPCESQQEAEDFATVKVVLDENSNCMYQSRSLIPATKKGTFNTQHDYRKFVGITAFKRTFLPLYTKHLSTPCQSCEDVEYNKILEMGYTIRLTPVGFVERGVNTPEDFQYLQNKYPSNHSFFTNPDYFQSTSTSS